MDFILLLCFFLEIKIGTGCSQTCGAGIKCTKTSPSFHTHRPFVVFLSSSRQVAGIVSQIWPVLVHYRSQFSIQQSQFHMLLYRLYH
jgi:hypothetical protein